MPVGRPAGVAPDLVEAERLVAAHGSALGRPMHLLRRTTSTSDEAKLAAKRGAPHGSTWVAEEQTAGRGRQGRAWVSPPGENLLFSTLVRVACPPSRLPPIALAVGLAVRDAVAAAAPGARPVIKWPNDVLVDGKKIAGVLVEAITMGARVEAVVVGVGVNVLTRAFPDDIAARATSVALVADAPPDRGALLADVLRRLDADLHVVVARGLGLLRARLDACDALRGRRVRSDAGDEGTAEGIDEDGRLMVRRPPDAPGVPGVLARWSAGEVHLVASAE
jgi:BirA family biotin operon repressor/biotin-[acetyl-CoA-carboxylase] ligase